MTTRPLLQAQADVLELLASVGTITSCDLAQRYGCTQEHVLTILRRLRERDLVLRIGGGTTAHWVSSSMSAQAVEAHKLACRARRNAVQRRSYQKQKMSHKDDAFILAPPRQVTVPAHLCKPIRPPAPASVFTWALQA